MIIDFNTSNLKATILGVNDIEALKRYKNANEEAISHWNTQKENNHPRAEENIQFFNEALVLCNSKIKKVNN